MCISYIGRLASKGTQFDACTYFQFIIGVGAVIAGLDEGILCMSLGQEAELKIHYSLAYGESGAPAIRLIPPYANLVYSVKLLATEPPSVPREEWLSKYLDDAGIEATGNNGKPISEILCEGRPWKNLMRSVAGLSIDAWLRIIDEKGGLMCYEDILVQDFTSAEEIVALYAKAGPGGAARLEPEFFEDIGVVKVSHRRLFLQWFEG